MIEIDDVKTTANRKAKDIICDHLYRAKEGYWAEGADGKNLTEKELEKVIAQVEKIANRLIAKLEEEERHGD